MSPRTVRALPFITRPMWAALGGLLLLVGVGCRDSGGVFRDAAVDSGGADAGLIVDSGAPPGDAATLADAIVVDSATGQDAEPGDAGVEDLGVDAGSGNGPGPGDLVFVEIQGNPQNTADTDAEYFELINVSGRTLDLVGCRLTHRQWAGSGMAPIDSVGNHRIDRGVVVAAGDRVLLTRSNGGYFGGAARDYVYDGFELSNGGADNNRVRLMAPGWDGTEPPSPADIIDEVITPAATFDNPLRGRAWQLDPDQVPSPSAAANDNPSAWCHAAADAALAYWQSNWGTPRATNACN